LNVRYYLRLLSLLTAGATLPLAASEIATATYTVSQNGPTNWHYSLTLNDTGTTNVGTFWFAWVPGVDFMPTAPTNITGPAGWAFSVTGANNLTDGSAIRWIAGGGSAETPGQSLSGFSFDSATTPAQLAGLSQFGGGTNPVATSFVYSGAPFSDAGFQLAATAATATPEPSSILLTMLGGGLLLGTLYRRT
jgi:hypothetical protein